jgi:hypothetical protein
METDYLCPACRSYLNIGNKIVFSIKVKKKQRGLLLLEKTLGDYTISKQDQIQFEEGELLDFYCPICHKNLDSNIHPNLASVILVENEKEESEIIFSKISGEHATYKIKKGIKDAFGSDKDKYLHLI